MSTALPRARRGRREPGRDRTSARATTAVVAEGFLSRLAFGVVSLALPLYALTLGMSLPTIGLLVSANIVVQLVTKPLMGRLVDRVGSRPALVVAILVRAAVPVLLLLATAPWQLFAARGVYGVAQSLRDPALNVVISDAGGKSKVARTFSWYHTAKNVAASVGRAAAGLVVTAAAGYRGAFLLAAVLSLLPLVPVLAGVPRRTRRSLRTAPPTPHTRPLVALPADRDLRRRGLPRHVRPPARGAVAPYTGLAFLAGTTAGLMNLFPVIATTELGLTPAQIGLVLLGSTVVVIAAGPFFGWLADTVSRRAVLRVRAVANCLSSLVYLAVPALPLAFATTAVAKCVDDVGKAAFRPAWGSVMAEVAARDPRRRGSTLALIELGEDAGDALGPSLAGLLLAAGGLPALLLTRMGLAVLTELWTRRLEPSPGPAGTGRDGGAAADHPRGTFSPAATSPI